MNRTAIGRKEGNVPCSGGHRMDQLLNPPRPSGALQWLICMLLAAAGLLCPKFEYRSDWHRPVIDLSIRSVHHEKLVVSAAKDHRIEERHNDDFVLKPHLAC